MSNGRNLGRRVDSGRDPGGFVALPWTVLDSPAFMGLSATAKALLFEAARQWVRDNNGRLLLSHAYLSKRGWNSRDVITRAKRELLEARLIHETVKGHRPNKASWYAVTWRNLDKIPGYDVGAAETFRRGSYMGDVPLKPKLTREQLYKKWDSSGVRAIDNVASLSPSHGLGESRIVPSDGLEQTAVGPAHGPVTPFSSIVSSPSDGHHLEMPSPLAMDSSTVSAIEVNVIEVEVTKSNGSPSGVASPKVRYG